MAVFSILFRKFKPFNPMNLHRKSLLVLRSGGIGDVLFITPILKELKSKAPTLCISMMTEATEVVTRLPFIDRVIPYSIPHFLNLFTHDYVVFLDQSIEIDPDAKTMNIYDLFSEKYFSFKLSGIKKPVVSFNNKLESLSLQYPALLSTSVKLGIQLKAASPVRTPSQAFFKDLVLALATDHPDAEFFLLGSPSQNSYIQSVSDAVHQIDPAVKLHNSGNYKSDYHDLTTLIASMNVIIALDSSVVHIAAGLDVPTIGIFGPFPSRIRSLYYPNTISFDAVFPCAPCFTHGHRPCRMARLQHRESSPCFDSLSIPKLAEAVNGLLNKPAAKASDIVANNYLNSAIPSTSETSKHRQAVLSILGGFIGDIRQLNGLEVGAGGDPLSLFSIVLDLWPPYTKCGNAPVHLKGHAASLRWFNDNSLDYLYSSHVFEDFSIDESLLILNEWKRVLKPGGTLALLLPDQQRYVKHCETHNERPNEHHKIPNFGPEHLKCLLIRSEGLEFIDCHEFWQSDPNDYNFLFIASKS